MANVAVYNIEGKEVGTMELNYAVFVVFYRIYSLWHTVLELD